MIDVLEKISLYEGLDYSALADISLMCTMTEFGDGEVLISENDDCNWDLFILIQGNVEVLSKSSTRADAEVVLSNKDKDIYGEISWLVHQPRTATVRSVGDVEAIRVDGDKLMEYLTQNTKTGFIIAQRIACLLAERLKHTDDLLKQLLWNGYV